MTDTLLQARWEKLDRIFAALSGAPAEQHPALLDSLCGTDLELRTEVQSLLDHQEGSTGSLSHLVGSAAASAATGPSAVGERFGPYHATALLGAGGMGAVYLAVRADEQFQKQVAIKLIKRGMDSDAVVDRFRHERQILASLDHPYIAQLLDGGTTGAGLPYFVMEYIQGRPIDEYCEVNGLAIHQRCELFRKMCEAVSYAHRNLVVHRDLKPSNILVTEDGTPKLLDFGIAKILTAGASEQTITMSMAQLRVMTPDYASPEQVRGAAVTTATDVYALGAVLYRLLTGHRPHRLDGLPPSDIEVAICRREPLRPSAAAPHLRRKLEGDLDNIILMAMRKESERRYQSVDALSDDLRRHLVGLPVSAREDTVLYRATRFLRRHRVSAAAAALAVVSLAGGAIFSTVEARRALRQQRLAEQRLAEMTELANTSLFGIQDTMERVAGATEARKEIVGQTLQFFDRLAKTSGNDPKVQEVLSAAYMKLGDVQGLPTHPNLGDTAGAEASYQKALALLERNPALHTGALLRIKREFELHFRLGQIASVKGRLGEAEQHHRAALALTEQAARMEPGDEAREQVAAESLNVSKVLDRISDGSGLPYSQKAVAIYEELTGRHPGDLNLMSTLSVGYTDVARGYQHLLQLQLALDNYRKAIALRERLAAGRPADTRFQHNVLLAYAHAGDVLGSPWNVNLGDAATARAYFDKSVAIAGKMVASDPKNANARADLVESLLRQGLLRPSPRESLAILRRASAVAEALQGSDPQNRNLAAVRTTIYEGIASRLSLLDQRPEALALYNRSLELAEQLASASPKDLSLKQQLLADECGIANLRAASGERTAAIAMAQKAVAEADRNLSANRNTPSQQANCARASQCLGDVYKTCGDPAKSRAAYTDSLNLWTKLAATTPKIYDKEVAALRAKLNQTSPVQ